MSADPDSFLNEFSWIPKADKIEMRKLIVEWSRPGKGYLIIVQPPGPGQDGFLIIQPAVTRS
jgi:hypothetical protein